MGVGKNALSSKKNAVLRDVVSRKHCILFEIKAPGTYFNFIFCVGIGLLQLVAVIVFFSV